MTPRRRRQHTHQAAEVRLLTIQAGSSGLVAGCVQSPDGSA